MTIVRTLIGSVGLAVMCSGCGDNTTAKPLDAAVADTTSPDAPAPGISLLNYAIAVDLTPDGRTALFESFNGPGIDVVLYDTVTGQGAVKTTLPDSSFDFVSGIAQNGTVAGLYGNPVDGAVWTETRDWTIYPQKYDPGCDVNHSGAFDISDDGTTTTGLLWHGCSTEAFRWTDTGGTGTMVVLQVIGTPTGFSPSNRGSAISKDGKVIAGFAANGSLDRTPAMWDATGHGTLLIPDLDGTPDTEAPGEVLAMNADGTVLAGILGGEGFVWTASGGLEMMTRLAGTMPGDNVYPNAVTADGVFVFGGVGDNFSLDPPAAFVWSHAKGMRALTDVVTAAGIALPPGTVLQGVFAASDDGTVLLGNAADPTTFYTFVLRVPAGTF